MDSPLTLICMMGWVCAVWLFSGLQHQFPCSVSHSPGKEEKHREFEVVMSHLLLSEGVISSLVLPFSNEDVLLLLEILRKN